MHRARHGHHGAEARHRSGRASDEEPDPARAVSVYVRARLGIQFRRLSHRHAQSDGRRRLRATARRAEGEAGGLQARRDARADGHRRHLLYRDRGRRTVAQLRHPRHRHVQFLRDTHPSHRDGDRAARHQVAGARPRNDLRPNHRQRAGIARRQHRHRGGQHRHRAIRPRHLRLALDAGLGRRDRDGVPQDQSQGTDDRRASARGARRRSRMGRRPLPREGESGAIQDHDRARLGRLSRRAARHGARPRGGELLRSAEHDLSVRRLYLRLGCRRRHRHDQGPALLRPRRLWYAHQSNDHRRSDPRRIDRGFRYRHGPGNSLRRHRQRR